jgi:hypothetical protein
MTWSDIPKNPPDKILRQFSVAWLLVFLAVGVHRYVGRDQHELGLVLLALAVGVGAAGLIRPASVRWLFVGCMVATFPIGWVVSKALLMLLFYGLFTPLAVFLRLRGRDTLSRKPAPNQATFWTSKPAPKDVSRYFHPY